MGDFPAKILVATDGSEDAMLAARAAISLVHDTGAELHVVHVGPKHVYPPPTAGPTPPTGTDRELRQEAQGVLDWQVDEITKDVAFLPCLPRATRPPARSGSISRLGLC